MQRELFSHVSASYNDYIYMHTPGTPLGEKNLCTAKQVFCHVMSNGWVAPCPYFPHAGCVLFVGPDVIRISLRPSLSTM